MKISGRKGSLKGQIITKRQKTQSHWMQSSENIENAKFDQKYRYLVALKTKKKKSKSFFCVLYQSKCLYYVRMCFVHVFNQKYVLLFVMLLGCLSSTVQTDVLYVHCGHLKSAMYIH